MINWSLSKQFRLQLTISIRLADAIRVLIAPFFNFRIFLVSLKQPHPVFFFWSLQFCWFLLFVWQAIAPVSLQAPVLKKEGKSDSRHDWTSLIVVCLVAQNLNFLASETYEFDGSWLLENSKKQENFTDANWDEEQKKGDGTKKKRTIHNVQLTGKKQETPVRDLGWKIVRGSEGVNATRLFVFSFFYYLAIFLAITKGAKTMTQQETSLWGISHEWSFLLFHFLDWGEFWTK